MKWSPTQSIAILCLCDLKLKYVKKQNNKNKKNTREIVENENTQEL